MSIPGLRLARVEVSDAGFEIVEHTADFGIAGRAPDLPALFAVMARGLFALIADVEAVENRIQRHVTLEAAADADLLHDWLEELNGLHHVHGELYGSFQVELAGNRLSAVVQGEPIDVSRHAMQHEVKGVTWHRLSLERVGAGYRAHVLFDV